MKPYRGPMIIECTAKGACPRKILINVRADCVDCPDAKIRVLDLDGKVKAEGGRRKAEGKRPVKEKADDAKTEEKEIEIVKD